MYRDLTAKDIAIPDMMPLKKKEETKTAPTEAKKQSNANGQGSSPASVEATSTDTNKVIQASAKSAAEEAAKQTQNPEKVVKKVALNMPDLFANMRVKDPENYLEY